MRNLSISSSKTLQAAKIFLSFTLGLIATYLIVVVALTSIRPKSLTLFQLAINNYRQTGGPGYTLERFREINSYDNIDILFIGSSHCYRSFDTQLFSEESLKTFNMGSTAQSPLNTYYLLKQYFEKLNPKMVIFETYFTMLESDGLESFYDLAGNLGLSTEIVQMAIATDNLHAINNLVSRAAAELIRPLGSINQNIIPQNTYIAGGYVSCANEIVDTSFSAIGKIEVSDIQLEYMNKIIKLVRQKGAQIILIVAPIPQQQLTSISNYGEISILLKDIADSHSVEYIDFNGQLELDTFSHFMDQDHLNSAGVGLFNNSLLSMLFSNKIYTDCIFDNSTLPRQNLYKDKTKKYALKNTQ